MSRVKGWIKLYPRQRQEEIVWESIESNTKLIIDRVRNIWYIELFRSGYMALECIAQIGDSFESKEAAMTQAIPWMREHPGGEA